MIKVDILIINEFIKKAKDLNKGIKKLYINPIHLKLIPYKSYKNGNIKYKGLEIITDEYVNIENIYFK
jgi:hypothetical protein